LRASFWISPVFFLRLPMAVETALNIADMLPATFTAPGLTEAQFLKICEQFPDAMLEYSAEGEVIVMPPTDPETSARVLQIGLQLSAWASRDGRGIASGPDGGFLLPDGSRRAPDAAWFDTGRWRAAQQPGTRFPVFVPDFVIEVRSPEQRSRTLREKIEEYLANGVQLAWLIDPIERTATVYRPGRAPEVLSNPAGVAGEGPVAGFVLNLDRILPA